MLPKVMLIDSDLRNLRTLRKELEGGYRVLGSSRGHAAQDLFELFRPQAVVANRATEGFEARGFLEWIRRVPEGLEVPVWVTGSEGAPESLFLPRLSGITFLPGKVHPLLLKVQLNWHFGGSPEIRPRIVKS